MAPQVHMAAASACCSAWNTTAPHVFMMPRGGREVSGLRAKKRPAAAMAFPLTGQLSSSGQTRAQRVESRKARKGDFDLKNLGVAQQAHSRRIR